MDCLQNLYGPVESLSEFISGYVSFSVHFDSVQQLNHHQDTIYYIIRLFTVPVIPLVLSTHS